MYTAMSPGAVHSANISVNVVMQWMYACMIAHYKYLLPVKSMGAVLYRSNL